MFKKVAVTISVVACVMLAIALAPNAHITPAAKDMLEQPVAAQPCAAFEAWFLDPACSKPHAKMKATRT